MYTKLDRTLLSAALAGCAALPVAQAQASVLFTGSGTWDSTAQSSAFSAPAASWSFVFVVPDTIAGNGTSQVSAFSYALNGAAVAAPVASVQFYGASDSGGFDINFQNTQTVSFYGAALVNGQSLLMGTYDVYSALAGNPPVGSGTVRLLQAVPEPATWATLLLGLAGVGALRLRRRRAGEAAVAADEPALAC